MRTSARLQRHQSFLEELGCTVFHVPGEKNELEDALSRLPMTKLDEKQEVEETHRLRKAYEDTKNLPISLSVIEKHQKDSNQDWKDTSIYKRGDTKLRSTEAGKKIVPSNSQDELIAWHHDNSKHPGGDRTHLTKKQYFHWKGIKTSAKSHVKNCEER